MWLYIHSYDFYRNNRFRGRNGSTALAVRKGIPQKHVDLPPLVSIYATGGCISIGDSEMLLSAVCKSPGHAWNNINITELSTFTHKYLLAGDLYAKHLF
jgi:hypothetical protein